jgi:glycine betaine/choline ABC-type transport system substrate-binding protein
MRQARTPRKRITQIDLRTAALHMLITMTEERFAKRADVLTSLERSYGLHPAEAVAMYENQAMQRRARG